VKAGEELQVHTTAHFLVSVWFEWFLLTSFTGVPEYPMTL